MSDKCHSGDNHYRCHEIVNKKLGNETQPDTGTLFGLPGQKN